MKYGNRKTEVNGILFDSMLEARRYAELRVLQRAGEIEDLQLQVPFELIPTQKDAKGRLIERAVKYVADFVYKDKSGEVIVEDTKGMKTPDYVIKRKLMLWRHGIKIVEIQQGRGAGRGQRYGKVWMR